MTSSAVADARAFDVNLSDGRTLRGYETGAPDGVPVVYHHGTPTSGLQARSWAEDAARQGIRLVSYDRAGYGASTRHEGRSVADVAGDVAAVMDHLGVGRFHTYGVSGGGPHTLACAALLPDRVISAATVASVAPYNAEELDFLAGMGQGNLDEFGAALEGEAALSLFLEKEAAQMRGATRDQLVAVLDSLLPPVDKQTLTGEIAEYLIAASAHGLEPGVDGWLDDDFAFLADWGFDVASIGVPLLILQGEQDLMVPFAHGQWLAGRIAGVESRLSPDEGHVSLAEQFPEVHSWLLTHSLTRFVRLSAEPSTVGDPDESEGEGARCHRLDPGAHSRGHAVCSADAEREGNVHDDERAPGQQAPESGDAPLAFDLSDAREQLRATTEVLRALGRSATEPDAVLATIVQSARQLCRADASVIYLLDADRFELASDSGLTAEFRRWTTDHPVFLDRGSAIGRVALDRETQQNHDVLADPDYARSDNQRIGGYRTLLGSPMMLDDDVVGVIQLWRYQVDPFDDRSCDLLTTFAAQAAIAIRQVQLVSALSERTDQLGRKVDQLEALGEVSQVVSSSLDLDEVLSTIVSHAVELSGTDGGSMMEYDEQARCFRVRTALATSEAVLQALRDTQFGLDDTLVGRAAREGRPLQAEDLTLVSGDPHIEILARAGWRSLLTVPMLRQGRIVGALVVRRRKRGGFSSEIAELLETFASQSALALVNARLYRELEQKTAELEVASRHKSEFLASMSHELRTPLNAVIGFSEVLLEKMFGDLNERQEEYLHDIWSSGKHLLELLNEILDLSKVEAGRMDLDLSEVEVRAALEYAVSLVRERATAHDVTLTLECGDDVGFIETDELRFKQVIVNLVTNAVKFTPDGGTVQARATVVDDELVIAVQDSGIGVEAADRERIFESFQQGGRGPFREEGTGLGLTLSRRIVELFGGRLWLDSKVGVGSTFSFSIPLARTVSSTDGAEVSNGRGQQRVVLIEDDRPSLDLLTLYLSSADVRVTVARDGVEGLEAVRRVRPVAVILDIRLPRIDGWQVLAALKADEETAHIPVIVVSVVDERQRGLALGAAAYLIKPVRRSHLLEHLQTARLLAAAGSSAGDSP